MFELAPSFQAKELTYVSRVSDCSDADSVTIVPGRSAVLEVDVDVAAAFVVLIVDCIRVIVNELLVAEAGEEVVCILVLFGSLLSVGSSVAASSVELALVSSTSESEAESEDVELEAFAV